MKKLIFGVLMLIVMSLSAYANSCVCAGNPGTYCADFDDFCPFYVTEQECNDFGSFDGCVWGGAAHTFSTPILGAYASFDGAGDYVEVTTATLNPNQGAIELWFKTDNVEEIQSFPFTISNNAGTTFTEFNIGVDLRSGVTTQDIFANLIVDGTTQWEIIVPESTFNAQTNTNWNHIIVTHDGVEATLYLNGAAVGSFGNTNDKSKWLDDLFSASNPSTTITLGAVRRNGAVHNDWYMNGNVDEIRIYDTPVSAAQALSSYNAGIGGSKSTISTGLLAYYDFEHNGVLDNTQWTDKVAGHFATPFDNAETVEHIGGFGIFNGNSGVDIGGAFTSIKPLEGGVSMWIKPENDMDSGTAAEAFFSQWHRYILYYQSGTLYARNGNDYVTFSVDLNAGQWYHIAMGYDYTTNPKIKTLYIDGQLVASGEPGGSDSAFYSDTLHIGRRYDNNGFTQGFSGAIDDVMLFDRIPTAGEMQQAYDNGITGAKTTIGSGVVGHWSFDTDFTDESINGNTGTESGALSTLFSYSAPDPCESRDLSDGTGKCLDFEATQIGPRTVRISLSNYVGTINSLTFQVNDFFDMLVTQIDGIDSAAIQAIPSLPSGYGLVLTAPAGGFTGTFLDIEPFNGAQTFTVGSPNPNFIIESGIPQINDPFASVGDVTTAGDVPEFSNVGVILAIVIIAAGGLLVVRRRK